MRFALLGLDSATLPPARAMREGGHRPVLVLGERSGEPGEPVRPLDEWELLLDDDRVDAVLAASAEPLSVRGKPEAHEALRLEQVRRLALAGVPLIAAHPLTYSVLDAFEIELACREQTAPLLPLLPDLLHPAVIRLAGWMPADGDGPLGRIEQVLFRRGLPDCALPRVMREFSRDVLLLRRLAGELTRVSALGAARDPRDGPFEWQDKTVVESLGVQLAGPRGIRCEWSPRTAAEESWELTVVGSEDRAVLRVLADGSFELHCRAERFDGEFDQSQAAAACLEQFGRLAAPVEGAVPTEAPTWRDAIRSLELTEALCRSLNRGRTIEVSDEESSEMGAFKSTMTSAGCLILMAGLPLVLAVAALDVLARNPHLAWLGKVAVLWPYLLMAVLGLFLLLQLFRFVIPAENGTDDDEADSS